jgi:circadian clock protein KaiC
MPRYKLPRVSTGIPNLDKVIEGGYVRGSVNLISGGPGTCKTIFAIQFLVDGLKKGESAIYITFEEKKKKIFDDMRKFGWDLEKYEKNGKFIFLEYNPEQVRKMLNEGGGTVEAIVEKIKAKRLVIDSITSFALLYEDTLTKKEACISLFDLISNWDCTAVLVSQGSSTESDSVLHAALEFEVDGILLVYHIRIQGKRVRAFEVLKMRGTEIPEHTMSFIVGDTGVSIDPKKVVVF